MGNVDSIPVISQVKSLVQVIGGDAKAAKRTQDKFARTGFLVSQVNSLGHTIAGDTNEARKIQEEFGKEALTLLESTPGIGHAMAGGYVIAGDDKKAEQVFKGATKTTVVMAAGIAGAVCGPAAVACGAGFAVSANALVDAGESLDAGESRGTIAGFQNLFEGKASVGDAFDTLAEQAIIISGGAQGAQGPRGSNGRKRRSVGNKAGRVIQKIQSSENKKEQFRHPSKRSIGASEVFNNQLAELPEFAMKALPGSIHDLGAVQWNEIDQSINAIFSIFLIIKMFMVGHPQSKGYFEEVCGMVYPSLMIQECEEQLVLSIEKYEKGEFDPENAGPFEDSLNALVFEMNEMVGNTSQGQGIISSICYNQKALFSVCKSKFDVAIQELYEVFQLLNTGTVNSVYSDHLFDHYFLGASNPETSSKSTEESDSE